MQPTSLITRIRNRLGLTATVVASAAFLAGCVTETQTPQLCANPELAKRDPKCPQFVKAKVAPAPVKKVAAAPVKKVAVTAPVKKPKTDYMPLP